MKRSFVNMKIAQAIDLLAKHRFMLPPFAYYTPAQWRSAGSEHADLLDSRLGWDVTSFFKDDFDRTGLLLFTLRNGSAAEPAGGKPYAEKIMVVQEKQVTPMHYHWHKMEDIINRGGGNLLLQLYHADARDGLADTEVTVRSDGRRYTVPAGTIVRLKPGESITLYPKQYHAFWAEEGYGAVLAGEVSQVNDDTADNRFYEPCERFDTIEEDEPARFLLCNEYERYLNVLPGARGGAERGAKPE